MACQLTIAKLLAEASSVYNIKRRMVQLAPISLEIFSTQLVPLQESSPNASTDSESDRGPDRSSPASEDEKSPADDETLYPTERSSTTQCLFCNTSSANLDRNLDHMSISHGLHIPNMEHLTDIETFVSYLEMLVLDYHECLYCGHTKGSVEGIRQHMLAKGHCMLDMNPDSDLLDFWEIPDSDSDFDSETETDADTQARASPEVASHKISDSEILLPSGAVAVSRSENRYPARHLHPRPAAKRSKMKAIGEGEGEPDASEQKERQQPRSRDQRVAVRGEMGMIGVPEQQRRALLAVEKKMLKQEVVAKARQRWIVQKVANKQKFFKVFVSTRWGDMQVC